MASPVIKIKRSSVQNNAPTAAQLELGELALNTYDGKLFTEINDGSVSIVEIGGHLQHLEVSGITTLGSLATANQFTGNLTGDVNSSGVSTFASGELEINRSGGNTYIDNNSGHLIFRNQQSGSDDGGDIQFITKTGEYGLAIADDSAVYLYFDGSYKMRTDSNGVVVYGNVTLTGTVDGRDVATDGTKLDGIESSATADQTASEILTLIKTVDGAGSGLDADTLDGVSSASFLRSDADDTFTGVLTVNGRIGLTGNSFHGNINSTGISTISGFRFPTSDGDEDQALVTDGNGSLSFKTLSGGGGGATGAATTISSGITTATQGQTVFSTPHPHNDGSNTYSTQVFVNGIKQRPQGAGNATKDYTTSSNSTITFEEGLNVGNEVVSIVYFGHTIEEEYFTATQGQVLFPLTGSLSAQKNFRVFVNGVKQRVGSDFGVAAPVTLVQACAEGANVEIVCDNAEDAFVATDQQTNFTPTSTDITEDNMQVYVNGVQLFSGLDYSIGSPSVTFTDATGLTVGDEVDVCIRRT